MYQVFISGYRLVDEPHSKPYYVYSVEVLKTDSGIRYFVEKRYSEFNALHRMLKKEKLDTAPFPPKRVRNSQPKVLEQRRAGLELYIQKMLYLSNTKQQVLNFLGIDDRTTNSTHKRIHHTPNEMQQDVPSTLGHYPVFTFNCDPYVQGGSCSNIPDIVIRGVLQGVYKS